MIIWFVIVAIVVDDNNAATDESAAAAMPIINIRYNWSFLDIADQFAKEPIPSLLMAYSLKGLPWKELYLFHSGVHM